MRPSIAEPGERDPVDAGLLVRPGGLLLVVRALLGGARHGILPVHMLLVKLGLPAEDGIANALEAHVVRAHVLLELASAGGPVAVVLEGDAAVEVDGVVPVRVGRWNLVRDAGATLVRCADIIGLLAEPRVGYATQVGSGHCSPRHGEDVEIDSTA